ncbi:hypothetical protein ART_3427 [Arthrobacter sp. PAMC 25486]|nr:hypothetical protein ART_3427 [Arthrobacter sp. PAMC 25486]
MLGHGVVRAAREHGRGAKRLRVFIRFKNFHDFSVIMPISA